MQNVRTINLNEWFIGIKLSHIFKSAYVSICPIKPDLLEHKTNLVWSGSGADWRRAIGLTMKLEPIIGVAK